MTSWSGPGFRPVKKVCRWFALCPNLATKTRSHPVLGEVPICDRCDDKINQLEKETA